MFINIRFLVTVSIVLLPLAVLAFLVLTNLTQDQE